VACRGVHFAITDVEAKKLRGAAGDEELKRVVQEEIEEKWERDHLFETDKAWDALHRCLSDGTLDLLGGKPPQ